MARVAIVTGGAGGFGTAIAERLRLYGLEVVAADLPELDVTDSDSVDRLVTDVLARYGSVDVLVNNAGVAGPTAPVAEYPFEEWRRVVDVNLTGTFLCTRRCLAPMLEHGHGRIVNIASIAGKEGNPMAGAYSSSKGAVIAVTKAIGKDVAGSGILVNCIAPAVINTPILGQISEEHIAYMTARIPLARVGEPAEVAALICWLASEEMTFSTGACFDISGGRATY